MTDLREAHRLLSSLKFGDRVIVTQDRRDIEVTVQTELHRTDGGGFGSWDRAALTVGFGPGRWNREVSAKAIADGYVGLRPAAAEQP